MNRFIKIACLAIFLAASTLLGQVTESVSTDFNVADPTTSDRTLQVKTDAYFMADNRQGTLVNSWSHNATVDSVEANTDGKDRYWIVSPEDRNSSDSTIALKLSIYETESGRLLETRRDTFDFGPGAGAAFIDDNTFSTQLGLNLSVPAWSTFPVGTSVLRRYAYYIYFSHTRSVQSSAQGAIATISFPDILDSLTIISADSGTAGERVFGTAMSGRFGYVSLFIDANTHNASTTATGKIIYQAKDNGGEWSGDIDVYGDSVFVLKDSVALDSSVQKAFRASTIPADSVKYGFEYLTTAGTVILNKLKALVRD